jgi:hypothetical protein
VEVLPEPEGLIEQEGEAAAPLEVELQEPEGRE